jgi:hypothetical protein
MFGLTPLGTLHTAISLVAVVAGFVALARDRQISTGSTSGLIFFWGTVASCLTGFGIFQHGGALLQVLRLRRAPVVPAPGAC